MELSIYLDVLLPTRAVTVEDTSPSFLKACLLFRDISEDVSHVSNDAVRGLLA
jgi:hypothetical protein